MRNVESSHWKIFNKKYNINTNFLEYGGFNLTTPGNCLINNILPRYITEVSNLYRSIYQKNTHSNIINNVCLNWYEQSNNTLHPYKVRNSFKETHSMVHFVDDIFNIYSINNVEL